MSQRHRQTDATTAKPRHYELATMQILVDLLLPPFIALVALVSLLLLPRVVGAAPRDVAVELSAAGLSFVATEVRARVPRSLKWPGFRKTLVGCGPLGGSASFSLTDVVATLDTRDVSIEPRSSALALDARARITSGRAKIAFDLCIGSTVRCDVRFSADQANVRATATPRVSNGKVVLDKPSVTLDAPDNLVHVTLSGCGVVSSLANLAMPLIKTFIVSKVEKTADDLANNTLVPQVQKALAAFDVAASTKLAGISVSARLAEVATQQRALRLGVDATLAAAATPRCKLGAVAPPARTASSASFAARSGEHLAVAVSRSTLQRALDALYGSGALCISSDAIAQAAGPMLPAAGALLGLGRIDSVALSAPAAPQVTLLPSGDGRLDVTVPLVLRIDATHPSAGSVTISSGTFAVKLQARLALDPLKRQLALEIVDIVAPAPTLASDNPKVSAPDPKVIEAVLSSVVLAPLKQRLAGQALLPQVLHQSGGVLDGMYLFVARRQSSADHVLLYAALYRAPSGDRSAPDTALASKPAALITAAPAALVAAGNDGSGTPAALMRFRWRVDGGAWSQPSFATGLTRAFAAGPHTVEVVAVDLADNRDGSPARARFEVDALAPTLALVQGPPPTQVGAAARVVVSASDDRSPAAAIAVRLTLERLDPSGAAITVKTLPFTAGATTFDLVGLAPARYAASLVARDEAGNVSTTLRVPFTLEAGAGAPTAPAGPAGGAPPSLVPNAPGNSSSDNESTEGGGCAVASGASTRGASTRGASTRGASTRGAPAPSPAAALVVLLLGAAGLLSRRGRSRRRRAPAILPRRAPCPTVAPREDTCSTSSSSASNHSSCATPSSAANSTPSASTR